MQLLQWRTRGGASSFCKHVRAPPLQKRMCHFSVELEFKILEVTLVLILLLMKIRLFYMGQMDLEKLTFLKQFHF